jgi:hypothetical protein
MTRYYIHVLICKSLINFIITFFVIATKKVTKEKSRQTRSLRAFCLASAIRFVNRRNPLRSLSLCVKIININK